MILQVILGGGLKNFNNSAQHSDGRHDGGDLVTEWSQYRDSLGEQHRFLTTNSEMKVRFTKYINNLRLDYRQLTLRRLIICLECLMMMNLNIDLMLKMILIQSSQDCLR